MVLMKFKVEENTPQVATNIGLSFSYHCNLRELVNIIYLNKLIKTSK